MSFMLFMRDEIFSLVNNKFCKDHLRTPLKLKLFKF